MFRNFTDEELTAAIIPFNRYLTSNDKEKALISLADFILSYGANGLLQIYEKLLYRGTENKTQYWVTPLFYSVSKKFELIVIKLLECEVPVDNGMMCDTNKNYYNKSPLMEASHRGYIPIAKALLDNEADLLHVSGSGMNCLMLAADTEMFDFLLAYAKNNMCDTELVMMKNNEDHYIFEILPVTLKAPVFRKIFSYFDINNTPEIRKMIHTTRQAYFSNPPESKEFDELCLTLKKAQPNHDKRQMVEYSKYYSPIFFRSSSSIHLFGKLPDTINDTKDKALERALTQYHTLLSNPSECMQYLQFLNTDFLRYYEVTRAEKFPSLDSTSVEFKIIDATYYPIPKPGYTGIKKHSALQEFLILLFRKYDLAQQAYKWSGFIPKYLAGRMLKKGDFVTEDTMGTGLFHNKLAHMLQQAILIYAIEHGKINLEYYDVNGAHKISIQDTLNAMLTKIAFGDSDNLWSSIRDFRHFKRISFCDPHRLGSVIMYYGQNPDMSLGIGALSDYLIDTFCKGFVKLLNAYQLQPEYSNLTIDDFIDKLNDLKSELFITPKFLIDKSIQKAERKKQLIQQGEGFGAIMKNYNPNESFEAKRFTL
jgi:hypothetical protein